MLGACTPIMCDRVEDFHGSERRCWPLDDVWLGPCMIVGAMVADEYLAQSWDAGDFEYIPDPEEAALHIQNSWRMWQKDCVDVQRVLAYSIQIDHTLIN